MGERDLRAEELLIELYGIETVNPTEISLAHLLLIELYGIETI